MTERNNETKGPSTPDPVRMRFNRTIVRDVEARAGKLRRDGANAGDRTGAALGSTDTDEPEPDEH